MGEDDVATRATGATRATPATLVGRDAELARLRAGLSAAHRGEPALVMVRGAPGIGKTSLLRAVIRDQTDAGARVLFASCRESVGDVPFVVARDLLRPLGLGEPAARFSDPAAGWAAPALADGGHGAGAAVHAVLHGLYWAIFEVAAETPLVLVVDDVQWCDQRTLQWLDFLVRRADGMGLALVLAERTQPGVAPVTGVNGLLERRPASTLVLERLSPAAVGGIVAGTLGAPAAPAFVAECARVSGGNPLVLDRLLTEFRRTGALADAAGAARLPEVGRDVVAASVAADLAAQTVQVRALARALAVLDDPGAEAELVAAVAGLAPAAVDQARYTLERIGILRAGGSFGHDLLRRAVLRDLSPASLTQMRGRIARLLNDAGVPAERVATHLLDLPRPLEGWMVGVLRDAAGDARRRGAPAVAARYLAEVVASAGTGRGGPGGEAPVPDRLAYADALAQVDPSAALDQLAAAARVEPDPRVRAGIAVRFGMTALVVQRSPEAVELLEASLAALDDALGPEPGPDDAQLRMAVEAALAVTGLDEKSTAGRIRRHLLELPAPEGNTTAERQVLAVTAAARAMGEHPVDEALRRARQALVLDDASGGGWVALATSLILSMADVPQEALAGLDRAAGRARSEGAVWTYCLLLGTRAGVLLQAGDVREAEADAQLAVELGEQEAWYANTVASRTALAMCAAVRGDAVAATHLLDGIERRRMADFVWEYHDFLMARAEAQVAAGQREAALETLAACGRNLVESSIRNPVFTPWWSRSAVILDDLGRGAQAAPLAEHGQALAEVWVTPRSTGLALLARGIAAGGQAGLDLLDGAVEQLAASSARLDHATAEYVLGRAELRLGRAAVARDHLRRAVDLATRCGAWRLGQDARSVLVRAGGRMRAGHRSKVDVLTGSERRVSSMAADGLSNRQIAQALFVTPRTVEVHLTSAYRKLGLTGRQELRAAFAQEREAAPAARTPGAGR